LTRVTRIFQKSVFTELRQNPAGVPRRVFRCVAAPAAAPGRFFCEKTEKIQEVDKGRSRQWLWKPHPEEARSAVSKDEARDSFASMLRDAAQTRGSSA
jgi:hypothetical protein